MALSVSSFHVSASVQKKSLISPRDLHHIKSSISSTFKPLLRELIQFSTKIHVSEAMKAASVNLIDAFVDSVFKFVEQPMLVQGNFAPVDEIGEAVMITNIEGQIPQDFPQGVYIRNGPNPLYPNEMSTVSAFGKSTWMWFEGEGMVHATYFNKDGEGKWSLSYKNRYVETDTYMVERERNKPTILPAATGQSQALWAGVLLNLLRYGKVNKDLINTNVFEHGGKVYAISENHWPHEINISNLNSLNIWDVNGAWDRPFTTHPKIDTRTGEMVIMGIDAKKPYYVVGIISADGKEMVHKVDLKLEKCVLSHELAITEKYNIIMDYPLIVDIRKLFRGKQILKFERERGARIGVMPRYGDAESIRWFKVEAHCTFHIFNSYEEGDEVVIRGCRANGSIIPGPDHVIDKLQWYQRAFKPVSNDIEGFDPSVDGILIAHPYEWRLNMRTSSVKEGYLTRRSEMPMDFPVINNSFTGRKNKYGYTQVVDSIASSSTGMPIFKKFAKLYFEEQQSKETIEVEYHELEENQYCSGAVFVEKPGGTNEDDGWVVCFVHDESTNVSQVHIIDAKRFKDEPVAKITLPQRVPYGFHGTFICKQ